MAFVEDSDFTLHLGDVRDVLAALEPGSVDCCVTSPPYWGLRDYGSEGQIGLEATPEEYVAAMVDVFRGVRRALADTGTLWLNLGDSYAGHNLNGWRDGNEAKNGGVSNKNGVGYVAGMKPKDMVGIPWRVAFALQADGWYLRSDIIWAKPNPMPESVTDRPTKAHEYVFLLSKQPRYWFDAEAIREPHNDKAGDVSRFGALGKSGGYVESERTRLGGVRSTAIAKPGTVREYNPAGRNARSVWEIATQPYAEAHFATFPEELARRCILAGCPEGGTVLDPFMGSGTTALVARKHGRKSVGIELNPEYAALAARRLGQLSLLA